jgi:cyclase
MLRNPNPRSPSPNHAPNRVQHPAFGVNRRGFIGLALGAGAALALSPTRALARRAEETFFEWVDVGEGLKVAIGAGGNSLVVTGKAAAAVIDAKNAPYGKQLRREAEALGAPVRFLVSTHHHADHTGGNHAFVDADRIGHDKCAPRVMEQTNRYISQFKESTKEVVEKKGAAADQVRADIREGIASLGSVKAEAFAPTTLFAADHDLDVGGLKVQLRHLGAGHTDNDIIAFLPDRNVIHTGDLLFRKVYPYMDIGGGATTKGWRESLRKIIAMCDSKTRVVPGHGEVTGLDGLNEQIEYFDAMTAFIAEQIKAGTPREEVVKMNPKPYDTYNVPWIRPITLGGIYDELKAGS